tara:strand:+ start:55 stop:309 length:255 start_codon:yes stop_codon:yes gene_type:complete
MGIKNLVRLAVKGFGKEFKKNNKNKKSIDEKSKEFKKKQETRRFLKSDEYKALRSEQKKSNLPGTNKTIIKLQKKYGLRPKGLR